MGLQPERATCVTLPVELASLSTASMAEVSTARLGAAGAVGGIRSDLAVAYEGKSASRMRIANDDLGTEFGGFLRASCRAMIPVCKGAFYICMSSSELGTLKAAFEAAGGHWSTSIIWSKNAFTLGQAGTFCLRQSRRLDRGARGRSTRVPGAQHPTENCRGDRADLYRTVGRVRARLNPCVCQNYSLQYR